MRDPDDFPESDLDRARRIASRHVTVSDIWEARDGTYGVLTEWADLCGPPLGGRAQFVLVNGFDAPRVEFGVEVRGGKAVVYVTVTTTEDGLRFRYVSEFAVGRSVSLVVMGA